VGRIFPTTHAVPSVRPCFDDRCRTAARAGHANSCFRDLGVSRHRGSASLYAGSEVGATGVEATQSRSCCSRGGGTCEERRTERPGSNPSARHRTGRTQNGGKEKRPSRRAPRGVAQAGVPAVAISSEKEFVRACAEAQVAVRAIPAGDPRQARIRDHVPDALVP